MVMYLPELRGKGLDGVTIRDLLTMSAGLAFMHPIPVKVPRYAVALVVVGAAIWVLSGLLYGAEVVACFSCPSVVLAPGISADGYPVSAIRNLAWDDLYASLYVVTTGLLALAIGLGAFRRGEPWAWYAVAVLALGGMLTGLLDDLSWGGWYTFFLLGLLPFLGLVLSAKSFFPGRSPSP